MRSSNQKRKLILLREILLEETDKNHPMSMKQIIQALEANGISAERKSIYDDIETLRLLGTDIRTVKSSTTGYYVGSRGFELSELKLLTDAVAASKFIPENQSKELTKKLSLLACIHDRPSLNRSVFVSNRARRSDTDIFRTVDAIHSAAEQDRVITFLYFSWTAEKKKEYRRDGARYSVSPWALVWDDSNYYLVGFDNEKQEIRHFRVDKMEKVIISELPREGREEFKKFDINSYSDAAFGMFGGKLQNVTLSCKNRLANVMLDRFGKDTVILKDGERFRITVRVIPSPVFLGWVMSFGKEAEIISPPEVAEALKELKGL